MTRVTDPDRLEALMARDGGTGLYAGFEGYRSATEDDLIEAVKHWLVVLDTNVLLNLYNFQGTSLEDFTQVFEALGNRLFVPHQVMDEFWRNRRTVLAENQGRHREDEAVQKAFDDIETAYRKWHQRVVDRAKPPPPGALRELDEARQAVLSHMREQNAQSGATLPDTPTHEDRVLTRLEPILEGRVGAPPPEADTASLMAEGKARVASKTPPGYMDGEKNPERAIGDFFVWRQTMEESRRRSLPVLLVTQDQKEDWWADRGTKSMRARPELVQELLGFAGQRLLMVRAHDLVRLGSHLGVEVSASTVHEAELSVDEVAGWTPALVSEYLSMLSSWPDHYQILLEAINQGGQITRTRMAEILGRAPDAGMTGVGKPYATVVRRLVEYEPTNPDLENPFVAYYESGGLMSHFVMDKALVPLFQSVAQSTDAGD